MNLKTHPLVWAASVVLFGCLPVHADETSQEVVSYAKQIAPILRANCQGCHQPAKAQGDYQLISFDGLLAAGESGAPAIVPGQPDDSYLLEQIALVDGEAAMPKNAKPLHASEIELIRRWIAQGAKNDLPPEPKKFDADNPPVYTRPPVTTSLTYSPNGAWIATSGFQEVLLLDAKTLEAKQRLVGLSERIESICFSPDSQRLAVTGGSPGRLGEVQVWEVESGELLLSHQVTYDTIYGGCFSPDGKLIAFGCADNTVRAIDSRTGEKKLHQGAHEDWVLACVFNPDGSHLLSAGRDMTVKLTEVATERFVDNVTSITPGALRGGINSLVMHPTRDEVLVGGADGIPKAYRIFRETERQIGDDANLIRQFPATGGRIFGLDVSQDGSSFAVVSTLDGKSRVQVYPYDFEGALDEALKNILKKRVANRSAEEKKKVDEYRNQTAQALLDIEFDESSLYDIAFSPDGQQLVVGGSDGLIRQIDIASGKVLRKAAPVPLNDGAVASGSKTTPLAAGNGLPIDESDLPNAESEKERLPQSKLSRLRVEPEAIQFQSKTDSAQIVVTAIYESGQTADVTRLATLTGAKPFRVSKLGLVQPTEAGAGDLQVAFQNQRVNVPVAVQESNQASTPDFIRDVNPILSRLGCNSGTCHGAQKGKAGFKLSLRGYDPFEDVRALSDDLTARRLNTAAPDSSLMLLKPVGIVPHEGGVLLTTDSAHYQTLRQWISSGAVLDSATPKVARIEVFPQQPVVEREGAWQQFRVTAFYPDGTSRDVTQEAFIETGDAEICKSYEGGRVQAIRRGEAPILIRYEGAYAAATVTVMGDRNGFAWQEPAANNTIDRLVAQKWQRMKIEPSEIISDSEFLRRVRLDLTGLPPSSEELREFLADVRPSQLKRQAKVDELIGSDGYVEHWTNKWADLLQVNSKFLGKEGAQSFRNWIRESVARNQPYDEFARDVLTASGSNKDNPAASYYKILREPDLMMENTTHLFLAIRFNCNKCHDHPFERWTQDQYYELAAFFSRTGLKADPASGGKKIGGTAVEGAKPLYEEVVDLNEGEMLHVRTNKEVAPSFPFECDYESPESQASAAEDSENTVANATRRQELAAWITSPHNPYFAKSFVNRLWGYLTGTGLIEPLDDIRAGNPPTNPELLDHLTHEFVDSGFDVQHVLRLICNSRTYQLSVATNRWNADDKINYSHAKARRLPAEVLYDAVYHVTGAVSDIPGVAPGTRAAALPDVAVSLPDGFLNNLGRPVRESACECERSQDLQLGPVMALVSGPTIGKAISDPKCALPDLASQEMGEEELIREIFFRVLSREATDEEVAGVLESAAQIDKDHEALKDQLAEREAWWKSERQRLEDIRMKRLAETKQLIQQREQEIAPERAQMEEERSQRIATAQEAFDKYQSQMAETASAYLAKQSETNHWFPLAPTSLSSSNKDTLVVEADRSIRATGAADKGTYTLTFKTPLANITGFRLEALTQEGIPGGGPGLPQNGNFVVTEIDVRAWAAGKPKEAAAVAIKSGQADFQQDGFDPKQVFDGNSRNQGGWAVSPRGGVVHWASFEFANPVSGESGETVLEFKIHQFHNAAQHRLAHFRISVTTDQNIKLGLPEEFSSLATLAKSERTPERLAGLISYLQKSDPQALELAQQLAAAKQPLAADEQLVRLQNRQKLLEVPTADEPQVVQLRKDVAASQRQIENRRLTLAQDLTWALINSPAFLFNH